MKRATLLLIASLLFLTPNLATWTEGKTSQLSKNSSDARNRAIVAAVRAVVNSQRDAWNRGDVDGYMEGYERSERITFISGDNISHGWQTVRDRYKKNYDSREKMGTLTFSDLETRVLSTNVVMMLGRWHLQRTNDQPHGRFTLVFRRTKQGWRIIHDSTTSAS